MDPNTSRLIAGPLGCAALGLVAIAAVQTDAQPNPPSSPDLKRWVQSTPNHALPHCPLSAGAATAGAPYFQFVTVPQTCLIDGPYKWRAKEWFVQRMYVGNPPHDVIRVCSKSAIHSNQNQFVPGPCRTAKGAGPKGCEICRISGVPQ